MPDEPIQFFSEAKGRGGRICKLLLLWWGETPGEPRKPIKPNQVQFKVRLEDVLRLFRGH